MSPTELKVLVLCGGYSTRMGSPKHLLQLADKQPIYQHLLQRASCLNANIEGFYISLRHASQSHELARSDKRDPPFDVVYDSDMQLPSETFPDIGPAAGLLAAFQEDDESTWLVIACDYPRIQTTHLQTLADNYDGRLTCFQNAEGFAEPLVGLWSPDALRCLHNNVRKGLTGPIQVVRELRARTLQLEDSEALLNANTPAEWRNALGVGEQVNTGL